jgi:hypothetical protein
VSSIFSFILPILIVPAGGFFTGRYYWRFRRFMVSRIFYV